MPTLPTTIQNGSKQNLYAIIRQARRQSFYMNVYGVDLGVQLNLEVIKVLIYELSHCYAVLYKRNTPYYPEANVLAESANKTLQHILMKIVNENRADCDQKLHNALWAYRMTYKTVIRSTPFRMAFGLDAVMPILFQIPSL